VKTAVGDPDELPRRQRNMPDWSTLESAKQWRFRPVPVRPHALSSPLLPGDGPWCTDLKAVERILAWMQEQGWGGYRHG
jgi:hypothetical protein